MFRLPQETRLRRWLLGILLGGLLLRLAAAGGLQLLLEHRFHRPFLIEGDANGYWELGRRLAAGEDYAIHTPPRYALRMPGFPALLAGSILLFGESLYAARLVLAFVGTGALWLVYVLGRRLFDERTGVIAAGLGAVSPVFIGFSVLILSETAFAATSLLSLYVFGGLIRRDRKEAHPPSTMQAATKALLTGVSIALASYMRPSWILIAPLAGAMLVIAARPRRRGLLAAAVVLLGTVLTLLPWGIRNSRVTGHFTLTTFWMGPSLYDGLNPGASGDSDMTFFDQDRLALEMTEYEIDRHYRSAAWEFVRRNPGRTLELAAVKLWRFWKPWPNAPQFDTVAARLAVSMFFLPVVVLAMVGAVRCRSEIWAIVICAGPILYFSALHMVFVSSLRYRLPAEYPLLILSAVGAQFVWSRLRGEGRGAAADKPLAKPLR